MTLACPPLLHQLGMRRAAARPVPRVNWETSFIKRIIIGNETRVYEFDMQTSEPAA